MVEIPDELLELLQLVHEGGSSAAPEIEHQRSAPCGQPPRERKGRADAPQPLRDAPRMKRPMDALLLSRVTTAQSGASSPGNASCPRDNHMWWEALFTKAMDAKVKPQSSYLNLGFWVMVTFSPIFRMIFLARAGETTFRIHRTRLTASM